LAYPPNIKLNFSCVFYTICHLCACNQMP